jgi:hypothetical protein
MQWVWNVARMGRGGMHTRLWLKNQKERDHEEDLDMGGRVMLRWILEK